MADFLDVNIPVGKLIAQIQVIKRLLNQAGVTDILEVNLDKASLARAQAAIKNLPGATVPVSFDVSRLPVFGPLGNLTEKVSADTGPATAAIAALQTRLAVLAGTLTDLRVGLDDTGAVARIAALQAKLAAISKFTGNIALSADTSKLDTAIAAEQAKLAALIARANNIDIYFNTSDLAKLDTQIAALQAKIAAMQAQSDDIRLAFTVDDAGLARADAQLLALEAAAQKMAAIVIPVKFDISKLPVLGETFSITDKIDLSGANAALARMAAEAAAASSGLAVLDGHEMAAGLAATSMARSLAGGNNALSVMSGNSARMAAAVTAGRNAIAGLALSGNTGVTALNNMAAAQAIMSGTAMNFAAANLKSNQSVSAAIPLWEAGTGWLSQFGAWGAIASGKIHLFGGALTAMHIPLIASISLWHLAVQTVFEFTAILIPATIALAAFGAMAAPTAKHIATQMQNTWTAANALNTSVGALKLSMMNLNAAVAPSVYMLFGEALVVATKDAGNFTKIAAQTGAALDQLGARAAVALTSGGFNKFLAAGPADVAQIGDIVGNIIGTIGNLLSHLPGYANILLSAVDAVTRAIEGLTGSSLAKWAAGAFLYFHGFIVWAGLAVTGAVYLGNALLALGAKFGLVSKAATVFDAAQFVGGLQTMIGGVALLGKSLVTLGGAEDIAAAGALTMEGAWAAITAINPVVWIAAAVAGLAFLIDKLVTAKSAAQNYAASVQQSLGQVPVTQLAVNIVQQQAVAVRNLTTSQKNLAVSQAGLAAATKQSSARFSDQSFNLQTLSNSAVHTRGDVDKLTQSVRNQAQQVANQQALLPVLSQDMKNYSAVLAAAGGNTANLTTAGITSNQVLSATGEQLKQLEVLAAAAAAQTNAFATSTGRVGAVMNALNFSTDTTQNALGSLSVDMTKVTQAQSSLMSTIIGGEQGFLSFEDAITGASAKLQTPAGLANAAAVAGASIGGLNAQSQALANSFYSDSIPAAQSMVGALENQMISTSNLTKVVATQASQMIPYVGSNVEARTAIVDLINNALGPGTVSLQDMNTWVKKNSTSLSGMNAIVATSEINASALGLSLSDNLNTALSQSILNAEGGGRALSDFATSLYSGQTAGKAFIQQGQQVIAMMVQQAGGSVPKARQAFLTYAQELGDSKKQAQNLWDNLTKNGIPSMKDTGGAARNAASDISGLTTQMYNQDLLLASKLTPDLNAYAKAVVNFGVNSPQAAKALETVNTDMNNFNKATGLAIPLPPQLQSALNALTKQAVIPLGTGVDTTAGKAQNFARYLAAGMNPALSATGSAADTLRNSHLAPLGAGVDTVTGKVQNLSRFLLAVPGSISSTVHVNFVGSGSGSIAYNESIPGVTVGPSSSGILGFHAAGGKITGGIPGKDSVLGMLMPGEVVVPAGMVQAGAIDNLRGLLPGFANGGSVSSTGMGGYSSMLSAGQPFMDNTEAAFGKAVEGSFASAVIASFEKKAAAAAKAAVSASIPNYKPGAGVAQWRGVVQQALAQAGSNVAQLTDAVLYQMQTESGGNPTIVNTTDSNWIAGHPSVGLMQVIQGTFDTYAGKYRNTGPFEYGVSVNPMANVYSAIKYAQANYGPGLRNAYGGIGTGHGYALGGLVQPMAAGGRVPGMAAGGLAGKDPMAAAARQITAVAALRSRLANEQSREVSDFTGLRHAFTAGPGRYWRGNSGLIKLDARERAEQAAYAHLAGPGLTPANLTQFGSAAKAVETTAHDKALNKLPGGHPGWAHGLEYWAGQLGSAGKTAIPPALTGIAALFAATRGHGTFTESAGPGSEWAYGSKALAGSLVPQSADRGTVLQPGMNLRWNGLGRPEPLVPTGGGEMHVHLHVHGPVGSQPELEAWLLKSTRSVVRTHGGGNVQRALGRHEVTGW